MSPGLLATIPVCLLAGQQAKVELGRQRWDTAQQQQQQQNPSSASCMLFKPKHPDWSLSGLKGDGCCLMLATPRGKWQWRQSTPLVACPVLLWSPKLNLCPLSRIFMKIAK